MDFLKLDDGVKQVLAPEAISEANKKMSEMFFLVFSYARRVAVDEKSKDVNLMISRDNWLEGYWSTIRSLRLRRRYSTWLRLAKLVLLFIPIWIGYALHDPANKYWQIIIAVFLAAAVFNISEHLEDK
ncbi:MAG: hypothetical protein WB930_15405 [Syntrophobacteraceae bacterium]